MRKILKSKTFNSPWWNSDEPEKFCEGQNVFTLRGFDRIPDDFYKSKNAVEAFHRVPLVDKIRVNIEYWQDNRNPEKHYTEVIINKR